MHVCANVRCTEIGCGSGRRIESDIEAFIAFTAHALDHVCKVQEKSCAALETEFHFAPFAACDVNHLDLYSLTLSLSSYSPCCG